MVAAVNAVVCTVADQFVSRCDAVGDLEQGSGEREAKVPESSEVVGGGERGLGSCMTKSVFARHSCSRGPASEPVWCGGREEVPEERRGSPNLYFWSHLTGDDGA